MILKYRLDSSSVTDVFFEETSLLGIIAPIKNYQFCWLLNNLLDFNFKLNPELMITLKRKNRDYFFNIYQSPEPNSRLVHYLYHNQFDGEYLLPEFKHMDFLWLMKGDLVDEERCSWIQNAAKKITGVQLVTEISNDQIRNKENMLF